MHLLHNGFRNCREQNIKYTQQLKKYYKFIYTDYNTVITCTLVYTSLIALSFNSIQIKKSWK